MFWKIDECYSAGIFTNQNLFRMHNLNFRIWFFSVHTPHIRHGLELWYAYAYICSTLDICMTSTGHTFWWIRLVFGFARIVYCAMNKFYRIFKILFSFLVYSMPLRSVPSNSDCRDFKLEQLKMEFLADVSQLIKHSYHLLHSTTASAANFGVIIVYPDSLWQRLSHSVTFFLAGKYWNVAKHKTKTEKTGGFVTGEQRWEGCQQEANSFLLQQKEISGGIEEHKLQSGWWESGVWNVARWQQDCGGER